MAFCGGLEKASSASFAPSYQGESTGGSSSESKEAPGSRPSPFAHVPREAPPSASLPCPAGLLRRKLQAKQTTPLQGGATRLPQPLQQQQQQQQPASPSGDFALAQWGFVPSSGVVVMSAKLSRDRDAQPRLAWPPNICILTLAMMIAGIPTVPVPGVREEDMIHAAQRFMAENLEAGEGPADGAPSRRWAALQRLGSSCKRDRQRRRAAHRSLLPLFLAQLEK
ncbi:spermatogenesis-associated protein 25 isoform X2 [Crotalus tigris]|uniref:spermatogenesis-associated protein 25 isoform X2 n=1 Tax=Crotalus tigris TaxID=88082 RepID=UPI00192F2336|nr:spermatogenesis-associated protein 25 isoform X2 [Crotalus tigris]